MLSVEHESLFDPLGMTPLQTLHLGLGKLVFEFQQLDSMLNMLLIALLREEPDIVVALTSTLPFSKKTDILRAIVPCRTSSEAIAEKLEATLKEIGNAEQERNRLVHASFMMNRSGDKIFFSKPGVSRKKGLTGGGIRDFDPAECDGAIALVQAAKNAVLVLGKELHKAGASRLKF